MPKVYSSWLLVSAVVFATAHAPTVDNGRTQPMASVSTPAVEPFVETSLDDAQAALPLEYTEADDLKRFGLDEFLLPSLDVTLPELFEWSDAERSYLAASSLALPSNLSVALDSTVMTTFPMSGHYGAYAMHRGGGAGGLVLGGATRSKAQALTASGTTQNTLGGSSAGPQSDAPQSNGETGDVQQTAVVASSGESESSTDIDQRPADGVSDGPGEDDVLVASRESPSTDHEATPMDDTSPSSLEDASNAAPSKIVRPDAPEDLFVSVPPVGDDSIDLFGPIDAREPVQVPTPGGLPLFALGLAGLLWTNRNKMRSGTPQAEA